MSESFVYTACPGWGDHEYCAIKSVVRDGRLVRTEPVDYTGPEEHEGYICQKGVMSCRQPYNPKRLTHPLKRAGARGSGQWERISWDQALDEIARYAFLANENTENIGARRLHTVLENLLDDISFNASGNHPVIDMVVDAAYVNERLRHEFTDEDIHKYIL